MPRVNRPKKTARENLTSNTAAAAAGYARLRPIAVHEYEPVSVILSRQDAEQPHVVGDQPHREQLVHRDANRVSQFTGTATRVI
jgi:hypothetical protein